MIDRNTYLHVCIALAMSLIMSLVFSIKVASFAMLALIIVWEILQAIYLIYIENDINIRSIIWDVFCGITGTFIGCIISTWIQNSIQ